MNSVDRLIIEYDGGRAEIILDNFLPASSARLRKLYYKFIRIGHEWEEVYVDQILDHIDRRIPELEEALKYTANRYVEKNTKLGELDSAILSEKKPNGVPMTRDELRAAVKKRKELRIEAQEAKKCFDNMTKHLEGLKDNADLISKLSGREVEQ